MLHGKNVTIITGYPRSRTAWLSVLFDVPGVKSAHEPIPSLVPLDQGTLDNYAAFDGPVVVCDSSAMIFRDKLEKFWPDARWYLIRRKKEDVQKSIHRLFPKNSDPMPVLNQLMAQFVSNHPDVCYMDYDLMNQPSSVEFMWKYAVPGIPFDLARFGRLCSMKIEAIQFSSPLEIVPDCGGIHKIRRIA
jgi:hypothetical protein